jgi:hypothetical protein
MFSLAVGVEDCKKEEKKIIHMIINISMFILSVQLPYYLIHLLITDTTLFQRLRHKTALRVYHALNLSWRNFLNVDPLVTILLQFLISTQLSKSKTSLFAEHHQATNK